MDTQTHTNQQSPPRSRWTVTTLLTAELTHTSAPRRTLTTLAEITDPVELLTAVWMPAWRFVCQNTPQPSTTTDRATQLCLDYLLTKSTEEYRHAKNRLEAYCEAACRSLYLKPRGIELADEKEEGSKLQRNLIKHEFIEECIQKFLAPYWGKSPGDIRTAAQQGEFRHIANRVKSRLISEIRRRNAKKNQLPPHCSLDKPLVFGPDDSESRETPADTVSTDTTGYASSLAGNTTTTSSDSAEPYFEFAETRRAELIKELGETGYEVLLAHFDIYPDGWSQTRQATKSKLTRAIKRRRKVSERQAQVDKREFREKVDAAVKQGSRPMAELFRIVAHGEDDHTLTIEVVMGNGRKRRIKFHFPLRFSGKISDNHIRGQQ